MVIGANKGFGRSLLSRRNVLLFTLGLGVSTALTAFNLVGSAESPVVKQPFNIAQNQSKVLRIGYQKYGTLNILKARANLDKRLKAQGVDVQWSLFPAGPQLLEALNTGNIDVGHTGEAPPIFAQAAGAPLLYVATQTPNPKGEAILVKKDSPIKKVTDLRGKKVALNKGSNVHYFLVKALEKAGVKYSDVNVVFLPPADARPAFEAGSVDAWAIWDPFYTAAKRATGARVLVDGEGLVANREFYLAARPFASKNPALIKALIEETKVADAWAKGNVNQAAELLSPELKIDVPTLVEVLNRRPKGVVQLDAGVVKYQQAVADTFVKLGLLPKPVSVKEAVPTSRLF